MDPIQIVIDDSNKDIAEKTTLNITDETKIKAASCFSEKKKLLCKIISGIVIFVIIASIAFGVYFGIFWKKEYKYRPPNSGSVINVEIVSRNSTSNSRSLTEDESISNSTYTLIVVDSTVNSIELIAVPGIVTEAEIYNLRFLSDSDEETFDTLPFYIAQVDLTEGKVFSMKKPVNVSESDAQKTASAISMAVINTRGEEKAKMKDSSTNACEVYGEVSYCPSFSSEINEKYVILKTSYNGFIANEHRRLEDSNPLIGNTNLTIEKTSYINKDTGDIDRSEVNGAANINVIENENDTSSLSESYVIESNLSAQFTQTNFTLSKNEVKDLKSNLEKHVNYEDVNLNSTQSYKVDGDNPDGSLIMGPTESRELELQDHGRNLGVSINEKVNLFKVLGTNVNLCIKMLEKEGGNLGATTSLEFGKVFSVILAEQVYGESFLKKVKQIINLKNILEEGINKLKNLTDVYVNKSIGPFQTEILTKIAELQSFLVTAETMLTNATKSLESTASSYIDKINTKTKEFEKKIEDQVAQTQNSIDELKNESDKLNNLISDANKLKDQLQSELQKGKNKLDDLKNTQIPNLEKIKNDAISKIQENAKNLLDYENLENNYQNAKTQLENQITEITKVINTLQSYAENIKGVIDSLSDQIKAIQEYANSQLSSLKNNIESSVDEIYKGLEDVEKRIDEEVTKATEKLNNQIADLQSQINDIENQLKTATEDKISELLDEKAKLQSDISTCQEKINTEISKTSAELNAQKDKYLADFDAQCQIAEGEFRKQMKYWSDTILAYKNQISDFSGQLNNIESQLINEKEQIENELSGLARRFLSEGQDLNIYYEDLKNTLNSQIIEKSNQINEVIELKNKLNDISILADSESEKVQTNLLKSKESIENEVKDLKSQVEESLLDVEKRIISEVTEARKQIESEIQNKQQELEKSIDDAEKALIQASIDNLNTLLLEKANLEQELLAEKQKLEDQIEEMKVAYLYMLAQGTDRFKEVFEEAQSIVEIASSKLQEFSSKLSESQVKAGSAMQNLTETINSKINNLVSGAKDLANTLESQVNDTAANIQNLTSQVSEIINSTLTIEVNITNILTNISSVQSILENKTKDIQALQPVLNNFLSTQYSILNGTYNWTTFFSNNSFLGVRKMIEDSVITPINNLYTTIISLKNITMSIVNGFKSISSSFLGSSKNSASSMSSSSSNVGSLAEADKVKSGTKLFDFSVFDKTVDSITNQFNSIKNTFNSLSDIANNGVTDDLAKIANIANPATWSDKLDKIITDFKTIETKFKVSLDYGDAKNLVLNQLKNKFSNEISSVVNVLAIKNDLSAIATDFATNALSSILSSQAASKLLTTIFGPASMNKKTLFKYNYNYNIFLPPITTPIGMITVGVLLKFNAKIDITTILSAQKISFEILPQAGILVNAGAEWNFVVGSVGAGAMLTSTSSIPAEAGLSILQSSVYYKCNFQLSISGKAGLYVRWITIKWVRKCWGRRWFKICILIPSLKYSNPSYFLYAEYGLQTSTAIIPEKFLS
ncbi:hypothetical protein SteCoe_6293 [Stentor coeruleus]|uniref:Uncharacterized protein n=1 Tax=Stentor coeruleus TaxID=5963 RepID=A0A1R2CQE3_9CILI|nr:hypothetical protein SteCoe_6293 [Stentor coeruleus]